MSEEELRAEVERLRAEIEVLKQGRRPPVMLKVSEKGGLSVYGLGRFPVTLYKEQWEKLLPLADEIRTFAMSKRAHRSTTVLKKSEKGGISVYGLGRFPVTLYKEQWEKLLGMADEIRTFIAENASRLKTKG